MLNTVLVTCQSKTYWEKKTILGHFFIVTNMLWNGGYQTQDEEHHQDGYKIFSKTKKILKDGEDGSVSKAHKRED